MIKPINNYILVEEVKDENILVVYSKDDKVSFTKGRVLAVSDDIDCVKEGNVVLFSSYALERVDKDCFVKLSDILAVYE